MDSLLKLNMTRNQKKSAMVKIVVNKEITKSETYEVDGRILALYGQANALGDGVLANNPNKSAVAKTVLKKEITEIESDTDEVDGKLLAVCGEANASGDDHDVAMTIVKKEIVEIESDTDEAVDVMLALCGELNASRDDALAKNSNKSAVVNAIVKKEIIEIESDSDTDQVGGRMMSLCSEVNALGDDALAKNSKNSAVVNTIVKKEIIEIESDSETDQVGGRMLSLCGEVNALGDDALAKNPNKSVVLNTIVKKELIEIESDSDSDSDTDQVGGRMLSLCGAENASRDNTFAKNGKTNRPSMHIVCADDSGSGLVHDLDYKKYLARCSEVGNLYLLEDNVRGSSLMRIMYNVDNEASDRGKARTVKKEKSTAERIAKSPSFYSVSKRLKTENGITDHKSISRAVLRTKETHETKEDVRRGRKKGDAQRGRKTCVAKENVKLKPTRNATSQTISRASKRLKTEIGRADHNLIPKTIPEVNTKDTQRKKREALQGRTKHNNESKSRSHVKDHLHHSLKPRKKENKESLLSMDKCYTYYLATLKNPITISKSDRQVKDLVCLSDPDIIAVSNHPFPDGGKSPFEATKDGKVIDLEDGIELDDIFNSSYSKKLLEILRKPYDETEFLKLYDEASLKRPLTRSRQLRDGREIEYNVEDQLTLSYLENYTDFDNKYRHYQKDFPRALILLRGFFFYLEKIVLEGAFKPWLHERRICALMLEETKSNTTPHSS